MQTDQTTLTDLGLFSTGAEPSVFDLINQTDTHNGREKLRALLQKPLPNKTAIEETQQILQHIQTCLPQWDRRITNGTIKVVESMYESSTSRFQQKETIGHTFFRVMHGSDHSLLLFSATHLIDFLQGMQALTHLLIHTNDTTRLKTYCHEIQDLLQDPALSLLHTTDTHNQWKEKEQLALADFCRYPFRNRMFRLLELHALLDAWQSMARVGSRLSFNYPVFTTSEKPMLIFKQLRHPLINQPVPYDLRMDEQHHFLFLTGANMAGKSTFIKSMGVAVYLAHCGMPVPAEQMTLVYFRGIVSNIHIQDNITAGESFFFNEVQRIKTTVEHIQQEGHWLVLIDELFKGTNTDDAMKCSAAIVQGLLSMSNALFVLSTHLYELGVQFENKPTVLFRYFETIMKEDDFRFTYRLQEGICRDRIGFMILKKSGLLNLL
ncbi:MAG: MutS-related protein [Ferruginibacter sp.]